MNTTKILDKITKLQWSLTKFQAAGLTTKVYEVECQINALQFKLQFVSVS